MLFLLKKTIPIISISIAYKTYYKSMFFPFQFFKKKNVILVNNKADHHSL